MEVRNDPDLTERLSSTSRGLRQCASYPAPSTVYRYQRGGITPTGHMFNLVMSHRPKRGDPVRSVVVLTPTQSRNSMIENLKRFINSFDGLEDRSSYPPHQVYGRPMNRANWPADLRNARRRAGEPVVRFWRPTARRSAVNPKYFDAVRKAWTVTGRNPDEGNFINLNNSDWPTRRVFLSRPNRNTNENRPGIRFHGKNHKHNIMAARAMTFA